jgi:hypothetical protein
MSKNGVCADCNSVKNRTEVAFLANSAELPGELQYAIFKDERKFKGIGTMYFCMTGPSQA